MDDDLYDLRTMFDEAQKKLERQFTSSKNLRDYANTIIGVSSIIVSFFATFKIRDLVTKGNWVEALLFAGIVILYGTLMIFSIRAARPYSLNHAIYPEMDDYIDAFADKSPEEILANRIALYLNAIKSNNEIIINQSRLSTRIGGLLGGIVVLILMITIMQII